MRARRFSAATQDRFLQLSKVLSREGSHLQPTDTPKLVLGDSQTQPTTGSHMSSTVWIKFYTKTLCKKSSLKTQVWPTNCLLMFQMLRHSLKVFLRSEAPLSLTWHTGPSTDKPDTQGLPRYD